MPRMTQPITGATTSTSNVNCQDSQNIQPIRATSVIESVITVFTELVVASATCSVL